MGLFKKTCWGKLPNGGYVSVNPDPTKFKIEYLVEYDNNTYAEIRYPNCTTFEGRKVMVFKGRVAGKILSAAAIDPHFTESGDLSPIARFSPTPEGKVLATLVAQGGSYERRSS